MAKRTIKISSEHLKLIRDSLPHGAIAKISRELKEGNFYVNRNLSTIRKEYDRDVIESALDILRKTKIDLDKLVKEGVL